MMKELLHQYARYNQWANKQMINTLLQMPAGAVDKEIESSFPSLRKTVYHTWAAEDIWLQRLQHVEKPVWVAATFDGTFEEACHNWEQVSAQLTHYVTAMEDTALHNVLNYHDTKGNAWHRPIWQVLQHVNNHATYHRGQLVTMARQAGATVIPSLDFILYMNKQKL